MGKIEENKKEKKQALLHAAFELFTEKGIDNTSVSEIAKGAKLGKGTFYLYFKDKFEIQNCLIAHQANMIFEKANHKLNDKVLEKAVESLEDCVIYLADNIIDQLNENPSLLRFISKNLSWGVFSSIRIFDLDNRNCMDVFESLLEASKKKVPSRRANDLYDCRIDQCHLLQCDIIQEPCRFADIEDRAFYNGAEYTASV